MSEAGTAVRDSPRTAIVVAGIGLLGVIVTAFVSNYDKLFPSDKVITATFSGYQPTGKFDTELRYYMEVVGMRDTIKNMQVAMIQSAGLQMKQAYGEEASKIELAVEIIKDSMPPFEYYVDKLLPLFQKYYTVQEIQELNKFYSTDAMQNMVHKQSLMASEMGPLFMEVQHEVTQRLASRLAAEPKLQ